MVQTQVIEFEYNAKLWHYNVMFEELKPHLRSAAAILVISYCAISGAYKLYDAGQEFEKAAMLPPSVATSDLRHDAESNLVGGIAEDGAVSACSIVIAARQQFKRTQQRQRQSELSA